MCIIDRVSGDHRVAYQWAQAGKTANVSVMGMWFASVGEENWNVPEDQRPDQQPDWDPIFGDREQMLVFIGQSMDEDKIRAGLDSCLLNDEIAADCIESLGELPTMFPPLDTGMFDLQ